MRFSDFSLFQILIFSAVVLIGAIEFGRWFGVRAKPEGVGSVPTLEGSILATPGADDRFHLCRCLVALRSPARWRSQ